MKQGWEIKRLEELAIKLFAGGDKPKVFSEHPTDTLNIPVYANGVSLNGLVGYTDKAIVDKESITISARGTIGFCCIRQTPFVPIVRLITIIPTENIKTEFLYYALSNATIENNGVAIPQLTIPMIKGISIPVPPIEEQKSIVVELDCLNGVIERKREQLRELDALAQSIFYQMFGDEVGQSNKWDSCSIGDIYKFQYGKGNKIPESKGEYPCYGSNGQVGYHTEFNGEDSPIIGHIGAYAGIVIWARGKHYVTYNGVICKLKHKGFHPIYGYYLLKAQNYMDSARGGAAQPFVSYDMLEAPIVYMPPLALQQEFAEKIEAIEKQKELIKQSITQTEELFNARMAYYFN